MYRLSCTVHVYLGLKKVLDRWFSLCACIYIYIYTHIMLVTTKTSNSRGQPGKLRQVLAKPALEKHLSATIEGGDERAVVLV